MKNMRYWLKHSSILAGLLLVATGVVVISKTTFMPGYPMPETAVGIALFWVGFLLAWLGVKRVV